jgi:hypothetical protein
MYCQNLVFSRHVIQQMFYRPFPIGIFGQMILELGENHEMCYL